MKYVTDRATDHTTDCIITTEQLTKKYKKKLHFCQQCFASHPQRQYLWFSRSKWGWKIYHDENAFGSDQADSWQLYH